MRGRGSDPWAERVLLIHIWWKGTNFLRGDTACLVTVQKRRCQSPDLLGHHPLLSLLEGPSSCRTQVWLYPPGWQHTWDSLAIAASVSVCGWPWLISQPVCSGAREAVISALNAGRALSNVGEPIKEQSLGDAKPQGPQGFLSRLRMCSVMSNELASLSQDDCLSGWVGYFFPN